MTKWVIVLIRCPSLQLIGEGGMGAVYMAEQASPMRRTVALKILELGMDSRRIIARFEAERQALAMMEHPNIARVLDAGTTVTGRPYFVMELVRGIPITAYCDQNRILLEARLKLFGDVCQAVQHAHQKGLNHRDLKPANILVALQDGVPVPKIIDFGIAKAIHRPLTDKTLFTEFKQFIGTPQYMSPEQASISGLDAFKEEIAAGRTDAKPEIWQDWEKFVTAANKVGDESGKLAKVAQSGDMAAIGTQVKAVGKSCGGCHKPFPKPKKEHFKQ